MFKFLFLNFSLFLLAFWGFFVTRKNFIIILMCIEMMLLSVNLNFICFSLYIDDILGQIMSLFILTIAAGESAIGLALLVVYYRVKGIIALEYMNLLKS